MYQFILVSLLKQFLASRMINLNGLGWNMSISTQTLPMIRRIVTKSWDGKTYNVIYWSDGTTNKSKCYDGNIAERNKTAERCRFLLEALINLYTSEQQRAA